TNGSPTAKISLYENSTLLTVGSSASVTSTTGVLYSLTWDATLLTDNTGAGVRLQVDSTAYSGTGTKKTDLNIGAVEWQAVSESYPATVSNPADTTPPNNVYNLRETHTSNSINLSWINPTVNSDFSYVKIYKNNSLFQNNVTGVSLTDSGLNPSTSYTYKITSVDTAGNESTGSSITVTTSSTTSDTTPPAEVTNLRETHTYNSATLTWTNPSDIDFDHVNVYNSIGTMLGTSTNGTYNITSLTASTQYTYTIKTVDHTGNISNGLTITVTTSATPDTTPPANVTNLVASPSHTTVSLTWTNPSDSDFSKVNIYRNSILISSPTYS